MNAMNPPSRIAARSAERSAADWPTRMSHLSDPELLMLGAYRHWLTGLESHRAQHFEIVSRELRVALGEADGQAAFATFAGMVRVVGRASRRPIRFHMPCCPSLGLDETQFIAMASACQHGRLLLARCIAEWVVDEASAGDLLGRISLLVSVMNRHGLHFPDRIDRHLPAGPDAPSHADLIH